MENHIRFQPESMSLFLLDQRKLPTEEVYMCCQTLDDIIYALQTMVVRGAPAIGVTAAWGCVIALSQCLQTASPTSWQQELAASLQRLAAARPTAVNLRWAVERMKTCIPATAIAPEELLKRFMQEAEIIHQEDIRICKEIGRVGAPCLPQSGTVMTHCNAGALATAGYGTALGVIRGAIEAGKQIRVIANETRPFLQGARLTAWELAKDGIEVRVACDNASALLMQKGLVDCVVVGADRIAANGDTANKIGTFGVALLARHFNIPFYVAAPLSTIDRTIADGSLIPIEERPSEEVCVVNKKTLVPSEVPVYNYAFDVTPAQYITGIITEKGVLHPPFTAAITEAFLNNVSHETCK